MQKYCYKVVPFIASISGGYFSKDNADTASSQLQSLIDEFVADGWEYYRMDKIDIEVKPGCLGSVFGASARYITYDQAIFRKSL